MKSAIKYCDPMISLLIILFFCLFLILLSVALEVFVLELSSKQHRPCREKTCLLGVRQSESQNQSLRLNRLDRKLIFFARGKSWDYSSQKADSKVADDTEWMRRLVWAFIVTNHRRQVFSVAVQLLYVSFNHDTYKKTRCEI